MIALVSDEEVLTGDFVLPEEMNGVDGVRFRGISYLKYRFICYIGEQELASDWSFLTDAPESKLAALIGDFRSMRRMWNEIGPEMKAAFFEWREGRPSNYSLSEDDLIKPMVTHSRYIRTRCELTSALEELTGAADFCELRPEKSSGTNRKYVFRNGCLWSSRRTLTREQWLALIDREIARDSAMIASLTEPPEIRGDEYGRFIAVEVRREVWRRDGGKCVNCGSQERLEFDHIIPVALGGSNTARNIQLLCEVCNREKGASLG
jgi:hypothetical protein